MTRGFFMMSFLWNFTRKNGGDTVLKKRYD